MISDGLFFASQMLLFVPPLIIFFIADEIIIQTTERMKEKILNGKCVRCHFHILFTSFIKLIFSRFCFLILTILGIKGTLQCTGAFSYFVNWRDMMLPFPI